jgi:hypothetical protein
MRTLLTIGVYVLAQYQAAACLAPGRTGPAERPSAVAGQSSAARESTPLARQCFCCEPGNCRCGCEQPMKSAPEQRPVVRCACVQQPAPLPDSPLCRAAGPRPVMCALAISDEPHGGVQWVGADLLENSHGPPSGTTGVDTIQLLI